MNDYTAGEEAYKNGYEAGYKARKDAEAPRCLFTDGVVCDPENNDCEGCGWNPDVAKARLEKFCRKHHIAYPLPEIKKEE